MASTKGVPVKATDIETELDAERMMKQHLDGHECDEWNIRLDGDKMENYVYDLKVVKAGWEDIQSVTKGEEDPDNAYINNIKGQCREIIANAVTV